MEHGTSEVAIKRKTIASGEVLLFLHTDKPPTDEQWDEGLAIMRAMEASLHGDIGKMCILAVTDGGAPTAAMRTRFIDWLNKRDLTVAVVTEGAIARGVVTALSWFNPSIKAFSPARWGDALRHARVQQSESAALVRELDLLEPQLRQRSTALSAVRSTSNVLSRSA